MPVTVNSNYSSGVAAYTAAKAGSSQSQEPAKTTAADASKEDTFVKSPQYKPDTEKVNAMKADFHNNVSAFKTMVQSLMRQQGGVADTALGQLLNIDKLTQEDAQAAIADGGYWGVEQTATRILDFAKALSGGDPSKIPLLRDAVTQGYGAAEKIWGGQLPDICKRTLTRIMEGFDEWEKSAKPEEAAPAE